MRRSSEALPEGQGVDETSRPPLWRRILQRLRPSTLRRRNKPSTVQEAASGSAYRLSELRQTTAQGSQGVPLPEPRPSSNDVPTVPASTAPPSGPSSTSAPGPPDAAGGIDPAPSSAAGPPPVHGPAESKGPTYNCCCDIQDIPPPPEGRRNLVVCVDGTANQAKGIKVGGLTTLANLSLKHLCSK